jgi:hypothetical protein
LFLKYARLEETHAELHVMSGQGIGARFPRKEEGRSLKKID